MNFKLKRPCDNCPFRKEGGIRLHPGRARELAKNAILAIGATFPCHKTCDYDEADDEGNPLPSGEESYCAGAMAFALNIGSMNQSLRIAQRLKLWNTKDIKDREAVFGTVSEMIASQRAVTR